jgi:hypothetical protein
MAKDFTYASTHERLDMAACWPTSITSSTHTTSTDRRSQEQPRSINRSDRHANPPAQIIDEKFHERILRIGVFLRKGRGFTSLDVSHGRPGSPCRPPRWKLGWVCLGSARDRWREKKARRGFPKLPRCAWRPPGARGSGLDKRGSRSTKLDARSSGRCG